MTGLRHTTTHLLEEWRLCPDGAQVHGKASLVTPVRTEDGAAAMLKVTEPEPESEHEHIALRRWDGAGSVRLLRADPHRRALLTERLGPADLSTADEIEACRAVAGLYGRIHVPALPQLRPLSSYVEQWTAELRELPRDAPIPRRLVEQAISEGTDLVSPGGADRVLHTDLHYGNVLAADREPWLVIDPKPRNGDPHYEVAPMLWNRWEEIAGDVRAGVRRRFSAVVDAADFEADRARAWVVVRMVHNAMFELSEPASDREWITRCIAVAKAVS